MLCDLRKRKGGGKVKSFVILIEEKNLISVNEMFHFIQHDNTNFILMLFLLIQTSAPFTYLI